MNIPIPSPKRPYSRFLELLRSQATGVAAGRVGFRVQGETKRRRVGLIARIDSADPEGAAAAVAAGADALEISIDREDAIESLTAIARLNAAPVGAVLLPPAGAPLAIGATAAGADWVRTDLSTPLEAISDEHAAHFISIPLDIDLRLAVGSNSALADAVIVETGLGTASELLLGDVLRLRALREVVQKPLILSLPAGQQPLPRSVVRALAFDALLLADTSSAKAWEIVREYAALLEVEPEA